MSLALRTGEYVTAVGKAGALLWALFGLAVLLAGGLVLTRGLLSPAARVALASAALVYGIRSVYGSLAGGNPFAGLVGFFVRLDTALGLAGDLAVLAGAVWLTRAAARAGSGPSRGFTSAGLVFLGALAFQAGIMPLLDYVLRLAPLPGALSSVLGAGKAYFLSQAPMVLKGLAGAVGLGAVLAAARRRRIPAAAAWAAGIWAFSDITLLAALWATWTGPQAGATSLAAEIRTSLFVLLPALCLLGLASVLRPEAVGPSPPDRG